MVLVVARDIAPRTLIRVVLGQAAKRRAVAIAVSPAGHGWRGGGGSSGGGGPPRAAFNHLVIPARADAGLPLAWSSVRGGGGLAIASAAFRVRRVHTPHAPGGGKRWPFRPCLAYPATATMLLIGGSHVTSSQMSAPTPRRARAEVAVLHVPHDPQFPIVVKFSPAVRAPTVVVPATRSPGFSHGRRGPALCSRSADIRRRGGAIAYCTEPEARPIHFDRISKGHGPVHIAPRRLGMRGLAEVDEGVTPTVGGGLLAADLHSFDRAETAKLVDDGGLCNICRQVAYIDAGSAGATAAAHVASADAWIVTFAAAVGAAPLGTQGLCRPVGIARSRTPIILPPAAATSFPGRELS